MKLITKNSELEVGREYWTRSKDAGQRVSVMKCDVSGDGSDKYKYLGQHMWSSDDNDQALTRYTVIGPLPERHAPDFDTYIMAYAKDE